MRREQGVAQLNLDEEAARYSARRGDHPGARTEFVEQCLPLAHRLAVRYQGRGEPFADLEQVARLGLIKAVDRYDPERGSFTAFAVITILGELRKHFRDRTWGVRAPRRLQDLLLQIRHTDEDLTNELSRTPSSSEFAEHLHTTTDQVDEAVLSSAGYTLRSLNAPVAGPDSAGGTEYGDLIGDVDGNLAAVDDRLTLQALLDRLPERERKIVLLRFYGNLTQTQIAQECGISQMHVSRLLSKTLTWLRHAMLADTPPPWSGVDENALPVPRLQVASTAVRGGAVTVTVGGEVDRDTAGQLRQAVLDAIARRPAAVHLDLSGVPFVDAAGIAALRAGYQEATRAAVPFRLRGVQPHVGRVLAVARLPHD